MLLGAGTRAPPRRSRPDRDEPGRDAMTSGGTDRPARYIVRRT